MVRTGRTVIAHRQYFEIREYPVPDPAPNTVLLRQEMAGICGTDLHNWQNGIQQEMLLGHENVGVVEAIGTGVETDYVGQKIQEGDRVVLAPVSRDMVLTDSALNLIMRPTLVVALVIISISISLIPVC